MKTVVRKDNDTIEVTKDGWDGHEIVPVVNEFKLDFLTNQRVAIEKQKQDYIDQRDVEITEVDELLGYFDEYPFGENIDNLIANTKILL